jgi:hypothetical protein
MLSILLFHFHILSKHPPSQTKALQTAVCCNVTPCLAFCPQDGGSILFRNNRKFEQTARCHISDGSIFTYGRESVTSLSHTHNPYSVLNVRAQVSNPYKAKVKSCEHSPAKIRAEPDAIGHSAVFTTGLNEPPERGPVEAGTR